MISLENITGNIVKVTVPEKLKADDFHQIAPQTDKLIAEHGKICLLLDATAFDGWENMQAFENHMRFVKTHHNYIECAALIASHIWQHWLAGVVKIFVHPEIRVFDKEQVDEALRWLKSQTT